MGGCWRRVGVRGGAWPSPYMEARAMRGDVRGVPRTDKSKLREMQVFTTALTIHAIQTYLIPENAQRLRLLHATRRVRSRCSLFHANHARKFRRLQWRGMAALNAMIRDRRWSVDENST